MTTDPKIGTFGSLCFLSLLLLFNNGNFVNDISKDIEASAFPKVVLNAELPVETRVLVAGVVSVLVASYDGFQKVCTSPAFREGLNRELRTCDSRLATWVLVIVQRAFSSYSPDVQVFGAHGVHLQCAVLADCDEPFVRAASLAVLRCFMSSSECKYNFQLFFMTLLVNDGSFLVRFHFVLLLKKFISSFESYSQPGPAPPAFCTFSEIHNSIFDGDVFDAVDRMVTWPDYKQKAYHTAVFLLGEYAKDPHGSRLITCRADPGVPRQEEDCIRGN
jgi:hypothetical protein